MINVNFFRRAAITFSIFVGLINFGPLASIAVQQAAAAQTSATAELALWNSIKDSGNAADFRGYLDQYPNGMFADIASAKIQALGNTSGANESKVKSQDKKTKVKVKRHWKKRTHLATGKAGHWVTHVGHKSKSLRHLRHKLHKIRHVGTASPIDSFGHGGGASGSAGGWH